MAFVVSERLVIATLLSVIVVGIVWIELFKDIFISFHVFFRSLICS